MMFPLTREMTEGSCTFSLRGVETINGVPSVRIDFDPVEPLDGKLRGTVWVHPVIFEPTRVNAAYAKPPAFVDRIALQFDYGVVETGKVQERKSVVEGSGGFAIIQSAIGSRRKSSAKGLCRRTTRHR